MKAIMFMLPIDLHTRLKMEAARRQKTLKDYVIEAIEQALEKGGKGK